MKLIIQIFILSLIFTYPLRSAEINLSRFDKDSVKALMKEANMPKILVISSKCFDPKYTDSRIMDAAISRINQYFQKLSIPYVSYSGTQNLMNNYGSSQTHLDIAMKANTTYYVKINIVKNELGKQNEGAYFSSVTITMDAFDTENGMGVASISISSGKIGSMISQNEANIQAAMKAASHGSIELIAQLLENIKERIEEGSYFEIRLFGVTDYYQAKAFKDVLTGLPEFMGDLRISNMNDYYRFEVTFKCRRPDIIVDKIMEESLKNPVLRKLDIRDDPGKLINFIIE